MSLPFCVYILFSKKDHLLYTDFTTDIEQRLEYHNNGQTKSTADRRPLNLVFCEYFLFEEDALNRELYFKTSQGKKAIKLMLRNTLRKLDYKYSLKKLEICEDF